MLFNVVVDAGLTSDVIVSALQKTGDFRIIPLSKESRSRTAQICSEAKVDELLMNVGLFPQHITLKERTDTIHKVRKNCPKCRIILLVDENIGDMKLAEVTTMKQVGLIDAFVYQDTSVKYLVETLKAICI